MTQKLYEMLKKKYSQEWNNFSIYGADERVCLSLKDKSFINAKKDLISIAELNDISDKYFNGFYKIKDAKEFSLRGVFILFEVDGLKKYQNYFEHSFWLPRLHPPLDMEISTGNRGNFLLTKKQRENYFGFVNDIFAKFKENALKK